MRPLQFEYCSIANSLDIRYVRENHIVEPIVREHQERGLNVQSLYIYGDYIDTLTVPDGVTLLWAKHIGLKSVTLPPSLEMIYLDDNFLSELALPAHSKAKYLTAKRNYIERIAFSDEGINRTPPDLLEIRLKGNRLTTLDFTPSPKLALLDIRSQRTPIDFSNVTPSLLETCETYEFLV